MTDDPTESADSQGLMTTICREYASCTAARYSQPSPVRR
jgi:hypothetical protein